MTLTIMNELIDLQVKNNELRKEHYFETVLFSYQWWILVIITVGLWIIWVKLVDKERLHSILLVGLITSVFAIVLDDIGLSLSLWAYPYQIVYFTSRMNPVDITIIPVFYMLLYQYFKTWKSYFIILILMALFAVFIAEPFFGLLNMYTKLNWEYWYSGPIYIIMGVIVKGVVDHLTKKYG